MIIKPTKHTPVVGDDRNDEEIRSERPNSVAFLYKYIHTHIILILLYKQQVLHKRWDSQMNLHNLPTCILHYTVKSPNLKLDGTQETLSDTKGFEMLRVQYFKK
jgi:hypothetical protein